MSTKVSTASDVVAKKSVEHTMTSDGNFLAGTVRSIVGPVVDFTFPENELPEIFDAITVELDDGHTETFEVEQQLGDNIVRGIADGQHRRAAARHGGPIGRRTDYRTGGLGDAGPRLQRDGRGHRRQG